MRAHHLLEREDLKFLNSGIMCRNGKLCPAGWPGDDIFSLKLCEEFVSMSVFDLWFEKFKTFNFIHVVVEVTSGNDTIIFPKRIKSLNLSWA